jgi:xylan 1,4-beta-xylosidase
VRAWPSIDPATGRVAVVVWNGTLDQGVLDRPPSHRSWLDRRVQLRIEGLAASAYRLRHRRLDDETSNLAATARRLGVTAWPSEEQWARLRAADRLADVHPPYRVTPGNGAVDLTVPLPMPSMSLIELVP